MNRHMLSMKSVDATLLLHNFIHRISQPWLKRKNSLHFPVGTPTLQQMCKTLNLTDSFYDTAEYLNGTLN